MIICLLLISVLTYNALTTDNFLKHSDKIA
jgi:hypothetical protein